MDTQPVQPVTPDALDRQRQAEDEMVGRSIARYPAAKEARLAHHHPADTVPGTWALKKTILSVAD